MIIAVCGLPGSGKSYFASKLADKLKAEYISSDIIRKQILDIKTYSEREKMKVYEVMIEKMNTSIQQDEKVVLDSTFYKQAIREMFIDAASRLKKEIFFIEVQADDQIIKERTSKKREHSDADYSVYLKLKKAFEPLENDHLALQSTQDNIDKMLQIAMKEIQENYGKGRH